MVALVTQCGPQKLCPWSFSKRYELLWSMNPEGLPHPPDVNLISPHPSHHLGAEDSNFRLQGLAEEQCPMRPVGILCILASDFSESQGAQCGRAVLRVSMCGRALEDPGGGSR